MDINSPCYEADMDNVWEGSDNDEDLMNGALRGASETFRDTVLDLYAASKVFCIMLITFEGLFVVLFSVVTTSLYYFLGKSSSGPSFGANISWTIVSFAVVSPMIMQIRQAFTRREQALDIIAVEVFAGQHSAGQCAVELGRQWTQEAAVGAHAKDEGVTESFTS